MMHNQRKIFLKRKKAYGHYTAEITVDDGHGNTVGESLQITVNDVPPAKPTGVTAK